MTTLVLLVLALPGILAAVDAVRIPDAVWRGTGHQKWVWIVLLPPLGWLGALVYVVWLRPSLGRSTGRRSHRLSLQ